MSNLPNAQSLMGREIDPDDINTFIDARADLVYPSEGMLLGSNISVRGTTVCKITFQGRTDTVINQIERIEVRLGDNGTFQPARPTGPNGDWSSWEFTGNVSVEGLLKITAKPVIKDLSGANVFESVINGIATVDIDLTPPSININPLQGITVTSLPHTARISGTVFDNKRVDSVEWRLGNSGEFQRVRLESEFRQHWYVDITLPGLGNYIITFVAKDFVGNSSQKTVNISVTANIGGVATTLPS